MTPRSGGWFRGNRHVSGEEFTTRQIGYPASGTRNLTSGRKNKKRLILSQSMVIDIDPNKVLYPNEGHDVMSTNLWHSVATKRSRSFYTMTLFTTRLHVSTSSCNGLALLLDASMMSYVSGADPLSGMA